MANLEAWAVGAHLEESYVEELFRAVARLNLPRPQGSNEAWQTWMPD
jgi:hypothetical protein